MDSGLARTRWLKYKDVDSFMLDLRGKENNEIWNSRASLVYAEKVNEIAEGGGWGPSVHVIKNFNDSRFLYIAGD